MSDRSVNGIGKGFSFFAKYQKSMGWMFIIVGIPLIPLLGIGFIFIFIGIGFLWTSKKVKAMGSPDSIKRGLDGIGAVVSDIKQRSNS